MRSRIPFRRTNLRKRGLSARTKLTIILITVAFTTLFIISLFSWQSSRSALNDTIFTQLTAIRSVKARQVERYFTAMRNHIQILSEDDTIVAAMVRFNKAFRTLDREHIPPLWDIRLESYYEDHFFPQLSTNLAGSPEFDNYRPRGQAATYLQYFYLATSAATPGDKSALDFARDGSAYSDYHADYHPWLRDLTDRFDYYDLFLIDFETGDIVYSVEKEVDFATNILTGPYARSALAQVVQAVQANPARYAIQVVDFQFYQPAANAPAAFIAAPIYNGPHVIGILALQFPLDQLNAIMTGNNGWMADGLGATGETYLVGADTLMRSPSRLLLEDPDRYRSTLLSGGSASSLVNLMVRQGTSIMRQPVRTAATSAVFGGTTGSQVVENYLGKQVLSAYTPLRLDGLDWALVAEIEAEEAFAPITTYTRSLTIAAAILVAAITFASVLLSTLFLRPLLRLIASTEPVSNEKSTVNSTVDNTVKQLSQRRDEFGELAQTYSELHQTMHAQVGRLEAQNREYLSLLFSNLPESVVERFRNDERRIIEHVARATVLFVQISDYADMMADADAEETATLINELDDAFYEAAERHDLVLFKLIGQQYVAACGLVSQRLDHARRAVDLAMSMRNIVNNFNLTNESNLTFSAGIDSGSLTGGIIGHHTFSYDLWGNAVRVAQEVKNLTAAHEIFVTEDICQQVQTLYSFSITGDTVVQFGETMQVWRLDQGVDDRLPSVSIETVEEDPKLDEFPPTVDEETDLLKEGADHD